MHDESPIDKAERLVLNYLEDASAIEPLLAILQGSDVRDEVFHICAALADYEVEFDAPNLEQATLTRLLLELANGSEPRLAFSATHALAIGNRTVAEQLATDIPDPPESSIDKLRLRALQLEGIRQEVIS